MNRARRVFHVVAWLGVMTCPLAGQLPKLPEITPFGIDGFRLMLQQHEPQTTQALVGAALENSPRDTVIVMLGDLSLVPRFSLQIERFVDNGGCLLLASDLRGVDVEPTSILGVWLKPTGNVGRSQAYRGFRDCPVVTEFDREAVPSLFEGVDSIIANRPGELTFTQSASRAIAWLPTRGARPRPVLMSVHRRRGGRMLFVADHSIFTNQMLVHGDNARFAKNVTDWLCADDRRKQLVVIHDGRVLPAWGLGDSPPPIPLSSLLRAVQRGGLRDLPIGDSVLPLLNASLGDFQQKDEFNKFIRKVSNQLFGVRPMRTVLLLLTALVVVSFIRLTGGTRARPLRWWSWQDWSRQVDPKLDAANHEKQYQPCMRSLAREFFLEAGLEHWHDARAPVVHFASPSRSKTDRDVSKIWKLATAPSRRRMSKRQFTKSLNILKDLCELHRSGDLRLEW